METALYSAVVGGALGLAIGLIAAYLRWEEVPKLSIYDPDAIEYGRLDDSVDPEADTFDGKWRTR